MEQQEENRLGSLVAKWQVVVDESRKGFYLSYVGLFFLFLVLFMSGYLIYGRGFIWATDGLEQQYMFFILQGEWLRELLVNVFVEHTFIVPMWTDTVGYGADYVVSVGNTLGNPILWLSVFATPENADLLLNATVPITLFLAGFAFLGYCSYKKLDRFSSLIGCMVYLFGGYSLIVFSQIYLLYPLLLAPLVLWGVDKVFDRESPTLFIFALFLCFFCSVSQAYVTCLALLVYCLVKVFNLEEKTTVKSFFAWVMKILGCIALAALLAGVMFFPNAVSLLSQDRLGLDRFESLTYSFDYYLQLLEGFISPDSVGADCIYGFAPLALVAVFGLFFVKNTGLDIRTKRILQVLFVVFSLFLCAPLAGRVFNGFAYPNNRWVWVYALLVSLIVVVLLPVYKKAVQKGDKKVMVASCCYGLICMIFLMWYTSESFYALLALLFATIALCYVFRDKRAFFNVSMIGVVAVGCLYVSCQWGGDSSANQVRLGQSYSYAVEDDASSVAMNIEGSADQRYDSAETHLWRNGNIANGMLGSTFYNSLYNSYIDQYHTSLGLATSSMNFSYAGFNSRTTMEAMAGVVNFLVPANDTSMLPPLYRTQVAQGTVKGEDYAAYQADVTLPLAFVYDSAISRSSYDAMSIAERQDVLTQAAIIDEPEQDSSVNTRSYTQELPSELSFTQQGDDVVEVSDAQSLAQKQSGVTVEGNTITITEPNTVLYLNSLIPANREAYFMCSGMDYEPLERNSDPSLSMRKKVWAFLDQLISEDPKECKIMVSGEGMAQEIWFMNNKHHLYGGKDDWAVNVGYSDEERHTIALQFSSPGVYSFDSFGVFAQDTAAVESDIRNLSENSAADIQEFKNGYSCVATADASGEYLYFRVPYAAGWTASVDGQPAEVLNANVGFMAVELSEGTHQVELRYETPNLRTGALLSLAGLVVAIGLVIVSKKRKCEEDKAIFGR
ncbi:MAG: YfhO family protein [Eggerthellaceae bacterium]